MIPVLIAFNVIAGLFLIGVVLLQSGKGADMGAAFGGASTTVFGASGAGNLLTKITAATATIFMGTSLVLAVISSRDKSVFANSAEPTATAAPAVPAMPPLEGQPSDGVDSKAAAEARGQQPLVADETDRPAAGAASDSQGLGPAGKAGEANAPAASDSPMASDSERHEEGVETPPAPAADVPGGAPPDMPAGEPPTPGAAVKNAPGEAVKAPTGATPTNPAGPTPANPTGPAATPPAGAH